MPKAARFSGRWLNPGIKRRAPGNATGHIAAIIGSRKQTPSLKKRQSGMPLPNRTCAIHG
jgi:hypothetical protein